MFGKFVQKEIKKLEPSTVIQQAQSQNTCGVLKLALAMAQGGWLAGFEGVGYGSTNNNKADRDWNLSEVNCF